MKSAVIILLGILLSVFISISAQAGIVEVYTQDPFTSAGVLTSSPWEPVFGDPQQTYDDFGPVNTSRITGIVWWGYYEDPETTAAFTISFYADNNGAPGSVLESYGSLTSPLYPNVDPYTIPGALPISEYSIALEGSFVYTVGARYWLSIYNAVEDAYWGWQIGSPDYHYIGEEQIGSIQNPQIDPYPSNVAFQIMGSPVPIPSAAWLLGSGLIGLVLIRRRIRIR